MATSSPVTTTPPPIPGPERYEASKKSSATLVAEIE